MTGVFYHLPRRVSGLGGSISLGRLDRRQRNGVDDIVNQCAARQVVHRLAHALQHRPDGNQVSGTLYRFVGGVAGVQIREDEHGRLAGYR